MQSPPGDIIIVFVGGAGSGKSYFIDLLTRDSDQPDRVQGATNHINATRIPFPGDRERNIVLVDTPGYGFDTNYSAAKILGMVRTWLRTEYQHSEVAISGLVYFHPVTDTSELSPYQGLEALIRLCNGDADRVLLVTTMWTKVTIGDGRAREEYFVKVLWKDLIAKGASMERLENTTWDDAWDIIVPLIVRRLLGSNLNRSASKLLTFLTRPLSTLLNVTRKSTRSPEPVNSSLEYKKLSITDGAALESKLEKLIPWKQCLTLARRIVQDPVKRTWLTNLRDREAQSMVDFLFKVLDDESDLEYSQRNAVLHILSRLAKSAQVYPECLRLNGVNCNLVTPVAQGGHAIIYKGKIGTKFVCIKTIIMYQGQRKKAKVAKSMRIQVKELVLWARLSHQNILPFCGVYCSAESTPRTCIVLPWMENGRLDVYIREHPNDPRLHFVRSPPSTVEMGSRLLAISHPTPITDDQKSDHTLRRSARATASDPRPPPPPLSN
ncbi:hypothetical protein NP233_g7265 [Leucocoprinus birnbaumii]|uniref:G domain-containing protein n=1 Tax=Leucocoprinus birnbaumii TaxID=56174 RepID=A0AAD5YSY1_9AGAR|nr:hypothetical protein NP233_g7265 [Leucocoprinus birnbaumii]